MDLSWEKQCIREALRSGPGCTVLVRWTERVGGDVDAVTGATVGAEETAASGTLLAFQYQTEAKTELRRFAEVQAGDVFLDVEGAGLVTMAGGVTVELDGIADEGVRFEVNGKVYAQARLGDELASATLVKVGDQVLLRTLILRLSR